MGCATDTIHLRQSSEGLVTTLDDSRHGLEDGDYVTFTEVKGMHGFVQTEPRKVTVKGISHFSPSHKFSLS